MDSEKDEVLHEWIDEVALKIVKSHNSSLSPASNLEYHFLMMVNLSSPFHPAPSHALAPHNLHAHPDHPQNALLLLHKIFPDFTVATYIFTVAILTTFTLSIISSLLRSELSFPSSLREFILESSATMAPGAPFQNSTIKKMKKSKQKKPLAKNDGKCIQYEM